MSEHIITPKRDVDEILAMLASNPSDHEDGPSHLLKILDCARRFVLDDEAARAGAEQPLGDKFEGRNVGTLAHFILECYHKGEDPTYYLPRAIEHPGIQNLLHEAWILGDKYMETFPRGFWGNIVGIETRLRGLLEGFESSGRVDAAWEIDDAAARRIQERWNLPDPPSPGLYVWDLKTAKAKDSIMQTRFTFSHQVFQYLALMRQEGHEPEGFIGFKAIRYKTDKQDRFQVAVVPARDVLTEENYAQFAHMRRLAAQDLAGAAGRGVARAGNQCLGYQEVCPHRMSGACHGF